MNAVEIEQAVSDLAPQPVDGAEFPFAFLAAFGLLNKLHDPDTMLDNLRHAHERSYEVLERIYIGRRFRNDTEPLEKPFDLYTRMTAEAARNAPAKKATRK